MPSPQVHTLRHILQYVYEGGAKCSASHVVCRPSIPCRSVFRHILQCVEGRQERDRLINRRERTLSGSHQTMASSSSLARPHDTMQERWRRTLMSDIPVSLTILSREVRFSARTKPSSRTRIAFARAGRTGRKGGGGGLTPLADFQSGVSSMKYFFKGRNSAPILASVGSRTAR